MTISPSFEQCSIQMGVIDAEIVKQSLGIVQLKRRRNQFIPIAQLPSELLLDIFEYYISSANERYLDSISIQVSPYNWIRITHICHHWRQTVLQCAKMWIRIVLGHHTPHEWMQELLKRSQDLSLIVEATSPIPVVCTDVTKPLLRPMVDYGILERTRELHLTDLKAPVQAHHSDILGIIPIGNRGISPARLSKIKAIKKKFLWNFMSYDPPLKNQLDYLTPTKICVVLQLLPHRSFYLNLHRGYDIWPFFLLLTIHFDFLVGTVRMILVQFQKLCEAQSTL
ncbi:hypothetical protein C8Q75DRAFT_737812 [Abortiporus biennis]|nr:hypothetical protein C8Q75DRAFT_737812 [Abortiporus biennis]